MPQQPDNKYSKTSVDYFTIPAKRQQNVTISPQYSNWNKSPSSSERSHSASNSYDESLYSATTTPIDLPSHTKNPSFAGTWDTLPDFTLPTKMESTYPPTAFDDWMQWDDPLLSPTDLSSSINVKSEMLTPPLTTIDCIDNSVITFGDLSDDAASFQTECTQARQSFSPQLSYARPGTELTPAQRQRLQEIAMSQTISHSSYSSDESSPEPYDHGTKRKSICEDDDDEDETPKKTRRAAPKKSAHNMIEKRYRTNLNDKIAALRDSVPSLRVARKNSNANNNMECEEDLQGLTPAHKLNKATILSKSVEYISHLERRHRTLMKENKNLKSRIEAFEMLMLANSNSPQPTNSPQRKPVCSRSESF